MATIMLAAAGSAVGGSFGGVMGLSAAALGRAAGATVGRAIDQTILGSGSKALEVGRVDRFRITGASEGAPVAQIYGRTRVAGQVIWSSQFKERRRTSGGRGKGTPSGASTSTYSYSISLAVALCEGEITRVGRVWADGSELPLSELDLRLYHGTEDQLPDPKIEAVEGSGRVPAYRGIAYIVLEDLDVTQFGNRVPQFNFEVMRPEQPESTTGLTRAIEAVALIPGTGEYSLATTPVHFQDAPGTNRSANVNTPSGTTDFLASIRSLSEELPNWRSTSLVVSWFGSDLRCGSCPVQPKVEQHLNDGVGMSWRVSGIGRREAELLPLADGRPIYGGTPSDQSVVEAIQALRAEGSAVMFYPFILMDQLDQNGKTDPWTGAEDQPPLPWRGRITSKKGPLGDDSTDGSEAAKAEVDAFFGKADQQHFQAEDRTVLYTGPTEWSFRRFVLHYAHLCRAAGGVDSFCIGSEMRSLTQIRGSSNSFPAVEALRSLARDVRDILGSRTKIGYAADWSEYFGYHPQDGSGDVFFHLDPLWADPDIDFVGVDNYMPLSDWRDGVDHADGEWGSVYSLSYLQSNIGGGEGFDWYYASDEDAVAQVRTPIEDRAFGEPWVYRYKDFWNWWSEPHHERRHGARSPSPTAWEPRSKPIWFTELGCAAVDKATNEPNKFLDSKSSESSLPKYSSGRRDDLIQMQYLRANLEYWRKPENNPESPLYNGRMVDVSRAHVWAWDARPYPFFPANMDLWSDGANYARGHWMNGRTSSRSLADVVQEICARSGVYSADVSELFGMVRGYIVEDVASARAALQPLMLAYGFDAVERDGTLVFRSRDGRTSSSLSREELVVSHGEVGWEVTRTPSAEIASRLRLTFIEAEAEYETRAVEAVFPDDLGLSVSQTEMPLVLTYGEGRRIVERWLAESRIARERVRLALPPSAMDIGAGDIVGLPEGSAEALYRVDRVERAKYNILEAVRIEPETYEAIDGVEMDVRLRPFRVPLPVHPVFLDLPLIYGEELLHSPHLAVHADPWPGSVLVWSAPSDQGYEFNVSIEESAVLGEAVTPLTRARPGIPDRGAPLIVRLYSGQLSSSNWQDVFAGCNLAAVGDPNAGHWEVLQFRSAVLLASNTWALSDRLRGQFGTDAIMPPVWPAGSTVVVLDSAVKQVNMASNFRTVPRHYRIGPSVRSYDDPSYVHVKKAFAGVGLRPYTPVHLRTQMNPSGDVAVTWIRRTRIEGDDWNGLDVPLGEAREAYLLRIRCDGKVLKEVTTTTATWMCPSELLESSSTATVEVAQISERYGPGPFASKVIK